MTTHTPILAKRADRTARAEVSQQKKQVSGRVLDENGEPLAGATVAIKGTTTGAITGPDGRFTPLTVADNDMLEVSFVGYADQTVSVKGKTEIEIRMVRRLWTMWW